VIDMRDNPDLSRLEKALSDAVTALPAASCKDNDDAALRRACLELVLLLRQTQERVHDVRQMFAARSAAP
jgi:hypothetical protein